MMRSPLENIFSFFSIDEASDISYPRLFLHHQESLKVFGQRHESWISKKIRVSRTILRYFEVISSVFFYEILMAGDYNSVGTVISLEAAVYSIQIFSNFQRGMFRMISIKSSIGRHNEQQITIVPCEIFMAQIIGKLIAEVRPNSYIDICLHIQKQRIQKLHFASSVAHFQIFIAIVITHWDSIDMAVNYFEARIVQIQKNIVQLEYHQKSFRFNAHLLSNIKQQQSHKEIWIYVYQEKQIIYQCLKDLPNAAKLEFFLLISLKGLLCYAFFAVRSRGGIVLLVCY